MTHRKMTLLALIASLMLAIISFQAYSPITKRRPYVPWCPRSLQGGEPWTSQKWIPTTRRLRFRLLRLAP